MQHFDLTLSTPAQNLAFDEALLEWAEQNAAEGEFLRLWESAQPMVVVGRSSRVGQEVNEEFCREHGIPILRRSSGGAAIVTGPGCLMYAVVLSYAVRSELKDITKAHAYILKQLTTSLEPLVAQAGMITCAGTSDLAIERGASDEARGARREQEQMGNADCVVRSVDQETTRSTSRASRLVPRALHKFSGNSLRVKRTHLLYHGTLLYDFDLELIGKCLRTAPRQPKYRQARPHGDFVVNVPATRARLVAAVTAAFPMASAPPSVLAARVEELVAERFGNDKWNYELA